jgi:hypothetical protein
MIRIIMQRPRKRLALIFNRVLVYKSFQGFGGDCGPLRAYADVSEKFASIFRVSVLKPTCGVYPEDHSLKKLLVVIVLF